MATLEFSRNEELNLDLRAGLIGTYGIYIIKDSRSELAFAGGLSANRELFSDLDGEWNLEAVSDGLYELYLFEGRDTTFATRLTIFPSLSTSGRYRAEFSALLRRKLVRDFTLSLAVEESYDSKPLRTGSKSSDLRIRTTVGWSF